MVMAVENMAHDNMSVDYDIISATKEKTTHDKNAGAGNKTRQKCQVRCKLEGHDHRYEQYYGHSRANKDPCIGEFCSELALNL